MQANSSRLLKKQDVSFVARPVFLHAIAYKTLNSYHDTAYIYKENYDDSGRCDTYGTKLKIFLRNLQITIDKCFII